MTRQSRYSQLITNGQRRTKSGHKKVRNESSSNGRRSVAFYIVQFSDETSSSAMDECGIRFRSDEERSPSKEAFYACLADNKASRFQLWSLLLVQAGGKVRLTWDHNTFSLL